MKINKSYLTHGYTCCYLSLNSIITNTFMHGMVRTTKSCLPITRKIGIFGNGSSIIGLIIKLISSDLNHAPSEHGRILLISHLWTIRLIHKQLSSSHLRMYFLHKI